MEGGELFSGGDASFQWRVPVQKTKRKNPSFWDDDGHWGIPFESHDFPFSVLHPIESQ